jgi:hypothetical protein
MVAALRTVMDDFITHVKGHQWKLLQWPKPGGPAVGVRVASVLVESPARRELAPAAFGEVGRNCSNLPVETCYR